MKKSLFNQAGIPAVCLLLFCACSSRSEIRAENEDSARSLAEHILRRRGRPLRELHRLPVIQVRDFGAVPDDGRNDWAAIRSAVAALGSGNAQLQFESGTYHIDPGGGDYGSGERPVLYLQGLENAVVDGQGAAFLIQRPSIGFCEVRSCTNVVVRNFSVDYDPLPFSQGTVVDTDPAQKWIEVETDAGFPDLDDPFFTSYNSWGMLKDPAFPGKLKNGAPNVLFRSACEQTGRGTFKIVLDKSFDDFLTVGDRYAQVSLASGGCQYFGNENISFDNLTFYAVPGSLFVGSETSRLNVLNCRAKIQAGRLLVSGADGVHCQAARVGPWVEGCEFEGLSDDCLNIYSLPFYITKVLAPNRFEMTHPQRLIPGDSLVFFRPQTGDVLIQTRVLSVDGNVVTLKDKVTGLNLAPAGAPFDHHDWKIYDHAYNPDYTGNYFVFRNNHLHDGRRFGVFIKASYGLIENNRFERLSDCAMQIQNEPGWPEGFWAHHLVIRNNRIADCSFLNKRVPVHVDWGRLGHRSAGLAFQKNIFFETNSIQTVSGPCAEFNCIDGLSLTGNSFESGTRSGPLVCGEFSTVRKNRGNRPQSRIRFEEK